MRVKILLFLTLFYAGAQAFPKILVLNQQMIQHNKQIENFYVSAK